MAIFKFCILCLILALAGCEKAPEQTVTEKKIEDSTGADTTVDLQHAEDSTGVDTAVDVQKNEMPTTAETAREKFTTSSGEDAEIPEDFPADVYIYRPSKVMTAMDMPKGGALGLTTADDMSTVAETYKREMTDRSWSEQSAVKNGERLMLVYEKEKRIANITIGTMEGVSQIMVTVTKN